MFYKKYMSFMLFSYFISETTLLPFLGVTNLNGCHFVKLYLKTLIKMWICKNIKPRSLIWYLTPLHGQWLFYNYKITYIQTEH